MWWWGVRIHMPNTSSKVLAAAVGRRKSASASVRLVGGKGLITVNGLPADKYFPGAVAKMRFEQPFRVLEVSKYSAQIKVSGGGPTGQLDAVVLGIARALVRVKDTFKPTLRKAGLLTRDPRVRQRRMVGMGGKSRRKKQSPKR